ncbi:hypothetical protein PsYK624_151950 [Phanerochaete sordida]|uniref:DUF6535 domain-containing protein n=1 Tax=Phanerochaete sordida TaxID=48140 RepID=A0A9P3GNU7_9APHY|nr:hypothetical protein PsYK624_151950 [Phanerochaete sordida]
MEGLKSTAADLDASPFRPTASVWQQMLKMVRDVDVRKVEDCKEDIDTLLVFAGLFSAVLTAFLVESYTLLQPGPNAEIAFLLRQSLARNYTFAAGHINSTTPYSDSLPLFDAPLWALRVNGLWFASIICSLSTASLAMLVKQWLREYLAIEWTVPQEQLRARQYRHAALANWKVFEIASALPLLLQTSLGLFFVGLCIFTAEIDQRIGRSTLPLVCGWGLFVLMTTVAPLASPRCPYKIPMLKNTVRFGRRYLCAPLRILGIYLTLATLAVLRSPLRAGQLVTRLSQEFDRRICGQHLTRLFHTLKRARGLAIEFLAVLGRTVSADISPLTNFINSYTSRFSSQASHAIRAVIPAVTAPDIDEEQDIIARGGDDVKLLTSVDEAMVNDALLEPMWGLVQRTQATSEALVAFAFTLIQHRTPSTTAGSYVAIRQPIDLTSLSQFMCDLVENVALEAFKRCLSRGPVRIRVHGASRWAQAALAILQSQTHSSRSSSACGRLLCEEYSRKLILKELVAQGGFLWHPSAFSTMMVSLLLPSSHSSEMRPSGLQLLRQVQNGAPSITEAEQLDLIALINAEMHEWEQRRQREPGRSAYYATTFILLALIDRSPSPNTSTLCTLKRLFTTCTMAYADGDIDSEATQCLPGDEIFFPISPKLALLHSTTNLGNAGEDFYSSLSLYAGLLRRCGLHVNGQGSSHYTWLHIPNIYFATENAARPILADLWRYLQLFATADNSSLDNASLADFACFVMLFVRRCAPYTSSAPDDPANPWTPLTPILRYACTTVSDYWDRRMLADSAEAALRRINGDVRAIQHRFPKKLLQVISTFVSDEYKERAHNFTKRVRRREARTIAGASIGGDREDLPFVEESAGYPVIIHTHESSHTVERSPEHSSDSQKLQDVLTDDTSLGSLLEPVGLGEADAQAKPGSVTGEEILGNREKGKERAIVDIV